MSDQVGQCGGCGRAWQTGFVRPATQGQWMIVTIRCGRCGTMIGEWFGCHAQLRYLYHRDGDSGPLFSAVCPDDLAALAGDAALARCTRCKIGYDPLDLLRAGRRAESQGKRSARVKYSAGTVTSTDMA